MSAIYSESNYSYHGWHGPLHAGSESATPRVWQAASVCKTGRHPRHGRTIFPGRAMIADSFTAKLWLT